MNLLLSSAARLTSAALLLLLSACSIKHMQGEDDILYTGTAGIKVEDKDSAGANREAALAAAEAQLAYAPNNALFGSSSTRWPLPLYRPWLYLRYAESTGWFGRWLHRMGSKPIWLRDVNPKLRAEVTRRILGEYGYLSAQVYHQTLYSSDSLEAKVRYKIALGPQYLIDSMEYLDPIPLGDSSLLYHSQESKLKAGEPFILDQLTADRTMLSAKLREHGYQYFNPSYISYEADSLQKPGRIWLRTKLKTGIPQEALRPWRIGRLSVRFLDGDEALGFNLANDSLRLDHHVTAFYSGKIPIRPKELNRRLRLRPDSLYRYSQEDLTLKSLASIGTFTGTEIIYRAQASDSLETSALGTMDMIVLMRRDKPWDVTLGGQLIHKTTGFFGPGLTATLSRRNLFGGGETLSLSASGSYEWQTRGARINSSSGLLNSYQFGADISLTFPNLIIPGRLDAYYAFPTTTTFKLGGQSLNRAGYYSLNTLSLSASYDFKPSAYSAHTVTPLSLDYTQLSSTTAEFDAILKANPSLSLSLSSQLIPSIAYAYTWTKKVGKRQRNTLWWRSSVKEAGNLTKAASMLIQGGGFSDQREIFKVPFAQFMRMTSELRFLRYIDRYQSLATRVSVGAIYSYGNMKYAPYMEQFFVGGANSIRAFTVRSLGPGSFSPRAHAGSYTFMDHVGEVKLELNAEFRRKLTQELELALFLDAGNVWLLRKDKDRPGGALSEINSLGDFLNQIAVGTGLGLRYDFSYLVIRLDAGLGLHLPYETNRRSWYNIPKLSDGLGIHLAIGYPF